MKRKERTGASIFGSVGKLGWGVKVESNPVIHHQGIICLPKKDLETLRGNGRNALRKVECKLYHQWSG